MADDANTRHPLVLRIVVVTGLIGAGVILVAAVPDKKILGVPFAIAALAYLGSQSRRTSGTDDAYARGTRRTSRILVLAFVSVACAVGALGLWYASNVRPAESTNSSTPRELAVPVGTGVNNVGKPTTDTAAACDAIRTTDMWWVPSEDALSRAAGGDAGTLAVLLRQAHSADALGLALRDAAAMGNETSVGLLLAAGADPDRSPFRAADGPIPAHGVEDPTLVAVRMGTIGALRLLLAAGADPNGDPDGWPLVLQAISARANRTETIELLLAFGAEINRADSLGRTALHRAASYGCGDAIEVLLANGADRSLRDRDGRTAMDRARSAGFEVLAVRLSN